MTITQNGNSFTWTGTVTVTNATNISTGVATLMLTPNGGVGNLPVLAQGTAGLPAIFDSVSVNTLAAGSSATATLTQVSPGGAGTNSHYTLTLGIPTGATGASGTMTIGSATDLTGALTDQYILKYATSNSKFNMVAQLAGDSYNATVFTSASGNASPQTLASLTIPAQPFDWRPSVSGFAVPTGTVNTHVDLICRLNNATTGDQVGYGFGVTGAGTTGIPATSVDLKRAFGGTIGAGSYGRVSKGSSATLYFNAIQTANTTDSFSVPAATCAFTVKVDPIPGTNT